MTLTPEQKDLRSRAKAIEVSVQIGKNGITDTLIEQIINQLGAKELVKVKALRSAVENQSMKEIVEKVVLKTGSILIDSIGFTFVVYKKKRA
jgi:RNA-binding protein